MASFVLDSHTQMPRACNDMLVNAKCEGGERNERRRKVFCSARD